MSAVKFSLAANNNDAPQYKVGERLSAPPLIASTLPVHYKKLDWDDLMPADWDPMKAIKKLNLSKMKDSDPRVMDAMDKVREAWNDAPVNPSLNGVRIEIPGFVVPLDTNPEDVKEFLLVPYFGACIHVPPPPSNQVVHVITPNNLTKQQQRIIKNAVKTYGAIVVSGTLETLSSNTSMGFSGYRIKADIIDPYIEPKNTKGKR
jgi:hypothetical protein